MNVHIGSSPNFYGPNVLAEFGLPIESKADAMDRMVRVFANGIRDGKITPSNGRRADAAAIDAAEVFWTNELEQMLSMLTRAPASTSYMVPGPGSLLPVKQSLRPGQTDMVYDIETPTGQAAFADPDGMRRLPQVGEFSERKRHRTDWTGIGYGFGLVESWQAAEKGGPGLDQTRAANARATLDRFNERVLLYGDIGHELPGLLGNSQCFLQYLGTGFSAITDPDDALELLQIIEHMFNRLAKSYGGQLTGMIAPAVDKYYLQRLRWGAAGEGAQLWPLALESFPWLRNVTWIDGLETASSTGGALWQGWSSDPNELWTELSPSPMLFGPWTDNLRTSWALLSHIGGVINRRRERMVRFEFLAV